MLIHFLSLITSFVGTFIAMEFTQKLLKGLPVGSSYFAETPIHGVTYGEVLASLLLILTFAFCIGVAHGLLFRKAQLEAIAIAASLPVLIMVFALGAVTLGMGLIILPIVFFYGMTVKYGVKKGGYLRASLMEEIK